MRLILQKWFWGVVILLVLIAAVTALLIVNKMPADLLDAKTIGGGLLSVFAYLVGRRDGKK